MNKNSGSVLFLLQDIKELAFGIALSLLGGILLCASPLDWDADELFLILSFPVLVYGAFRIRNGGGSHVLIITNDSPQGRRHPCPLKPTNKTDWSGSPLRT